MKAHASDYRRYQEVSITFGKTDCERGIRLLSPERIPIEKKGKKWCRRTDWAVRRPINLEVDDAFFAGDPQRVEVRIDYFDGGKDTFAAVAQTVEGDYRVGRIIQKTDSRSWRHLTSTLWAPRFGAREDSLIHPDLRINPRWDGDEWIKSVRVRIPYLHPYTEKPGNLFGRDETVKCRIKLLNRKAPESFRLFWQVENWKGEPVRHGEDEIEAVSGFSVAKEMSLDPLPLGSYTVSFILKKGNAVIEETALHFGVTDPVLLQEDPGQSPFGVCTELGTALSQEKARILRESGIIWVRQSIPGNRIYAGGKADWRATDLAYDTARKEKLYLLALLLGAPPGTEDFATEAGRSRFASFVTEVARRYPDLSEWEVWNEPDTLGFWGAHDSKKYLALLKTVYAALKAVKPSYRVLNGGVVAGNYWFLGELFQAGAGQFLDAAAVHAYVETLEFGKWNLAMKLNAARDLLLKDDPKRKLWITEIGWQTSATGVSPDEQARRLVEGMVVALASPAVEKIFWFNFDDLGEDPTSENQHYGLVFKDLSPKPSLLAYRHLIRRLSGKKMVSRDNLGEGISAYRFEGAGGTALVVWSRKGPRTISLHAGKKMRSFDLMGNETDPTLVSENPQFIIW